jgi:hypothetical protein
VKLGSILSFTPCAVRSFSRSSFILSSGAHGNTQLDHRRCRQDYEANDLERQRATGRRQRLKSVTFWPRIAVCSIALAEASSTGRTTSLPMGILCKLPRRYYHGLRRRGSKPRAPCHQASRRRWLASLAGYSSGNSFLTICPVDHLEQHSAPEHLLLGVGGMLPPFRRLPDSEPGLSTLGR